MKRLHTLTPLPCKLTLAVCRKIIIGTPTVTVLWLSICACPIEVNPPAMSAPPIAIFAHDKKAETHADSRAWLKSRVSSPPVKAPVLHKHSPVSRKGSSLQREDDSLSRVKLFQRFRDGWQVPRRLCTNPACTRTPCRPCLFRNICPATKTH